MAPKPTPPPTPDPPGGAFQTAEGKSLRFLNLDNLTIDDAGRMFIGDQYVETAAQTAAPEPREVIVRSRN